MYVCTFIHSLVFLSHSWNKGQSFCVKIYKTLHYKDPLMDLIFIWHDGRFRSKVLLIAIPILGSDLEVKVMDLEFSHKNQSFCTCVLYSFLVLLRPFDEFHVYLAGW